MAGYGFDLIKIGGVFAVETMVHVIIDQSPFGIAHGIFNRVQLLCDIGTGFALFDHFDDRAKMSISTFQPSDQCRVICMLVSMCHISP